jgi:hypothetical protein
LQKPRHRAADPHKDVEKARPRAMAQSARGFAESLGIGGDELFLAKKPFRGGLFKLCAKREMNEPVGKIGRRAGEPAASLSLPPQRGGGDLINQIHGRVADESKVATSLRP